MAAPHVLRMPSAQRCLKSARAHIHTGRRKLSAIPSSAPVGGHNIPWLANCNPWPQGSNRNPTATLPSDLDAVIILAGGLREDGGSPPWVERRLQTAAGIRAVQVAQGNDCPILCLGGGTPHKPPILGSDQYVIHESTSCAAYLMEHCNVPATAILKEVSSYDTVGNSYFALTIHAIPAGWRKMAVVTSAFHMPRTQALFTDMFQVAANDLYKQPDRYSMWFASSSDDGLWSDEVLAVRATKEQQAVETWRKNAARIHTLKELHEWLYATHQCYSVRRQHEANVNTITDKRLLASY